MEDILQPLLVIIIGGLFAPILTQLIEKLYSYTTGNPIAKVPEKGDDKVVKKKKWIRFLTIAVLIQLLLFTCFFFITKWSYYDNNYYNTSERELIRVGLKKKKDYVIPKITIRIFSELKNDISFSDSICNGNSINYCSLVSISYEIVALKEFNSKKIFMEYYNAVYAANVIKEPGSENEGEDMNPTKTIATYDIITSIKKFERKTITTRADYLYDTLPLTRKFFGKSITEKNWDLFYYPNKEDDVIGEVEFQIISRSLKFDSPNMNDAIYEDENRVQTSINPLLTISNGECLKFNIITAKIPKLKNNEGFGIKWKWSN